MSTVAGISRNVDRISSVLYTGQLVVILVFYVVPLGYCVALSLGLAGTVSGGSVEFGAYGTVLKSPRVGMALANSLELGLLSAVVAVPTGAVVARMVLGSETTRGRLLVLAVLLVPLLSSSILRMFGYGVILSDSSPIGRLIRALGGTGILFTKPAIVVGLVSSVLPVCTLLFFISFLRVEEAEILAARNLGASFWQIFLHIELRRSIGVAIICLQLCVVFALGDLLTQSILGGSNTYTYAAALNDRVKINDWPTAAAMSVLLIVAVSFVVGTVVALASRRSRS